MGCDLFYAKDLWACDMYENLLDIHVDVDQRKNGSFPSWAEIYFV